MRVCDKFTSSIILCLSECTQKYSTINFFCLIFKRTFWWKHTITIKTFRRSNKCKYFIQFWLCLIFVFWYKPLILFIYAKKFNLFQTVYAEHIYIARSLSGYMQCTFYLLVRNIYILEMYMKYTIYTVCLNNM